jgi:hypothetical protein
LDIVNASAVDDRLVEAARAHRALMGRAQRTTCHCPDAVLNLGATIAAHTAHISYLRGLNRFLDESMLVELAVEHRRLAEDLELLESLDRSDSPDIGPLACALVARIQQLLDREQRIFYEPLLRLAASDEADSRSHRP